MIRYKVFPVKTIMDAWDQENANFVVDGQVHKRSQRIELFFEKGITCVECGIKGSVFWLESNVKKESPHLNLYAVKNDKFVLMTKDHIFPKSKGGENILENYQTMCQICNMKKSNKIITVKTNKNVSNAI